MLRYKFVPDKYLYVALAIIAAINILLSFLLMRRRNIKIARFFGYVISITVSATAIFGIYMVNNAIITLENISNNNQNVITLSIIVLKDSAIKDETQLKDHSIAYANLQDEAYINKVTDGLSSKSTIKAASYPVLVNNLYDKTSDAIIFNESYRGLIESILVDFKDETRIIKQYTFKDSNTSTKTNLVSNSSPYNIYISGVDTRDPTSTNGLSDSNIIATIDPVGKKILLTTIPRDSYLPIALGGNNQLDKLTHAGIYGIDSSVKTIENLLNIQVAAYLRVNFTALIDLVDELGGVDVDNPIAFTSTDKDAYFQAGTVHLDGKKALTYSRERQQLQNGDNDRGKNQERVIVAIFKKISQPEYLLNYQSILSTLGTSIQTSLKPETIALLVNMQVSYGGDWNIHMNALSGKGAMGLLSYAMPGSYVYVTKLSDESIVLAKEKISNIMK